MVPISKSSLVCLNRNSLSLFPSEKQYYASFILPVLTLHFTVRSDFNLPPTFSPSVSLTTPHTLLVSSPPGTSYLPDTFDDIGNFNQLATISQVIHPPGPDISKTGLFNAYYLYFQPAHPFLLPHSQMLELLGRVRLPHLELAIQYIGSLYIPAAPTPMYLDALQQALSSSTITKDGYVVQTYLLMAVGLHINDQEEQSASAMQSAISLAMKLEMNKRYYATDAGGNSPLFAESWRRTWWELFVIDGMFAGTNPSYTPQLFGTVTDLYLPCDDAEYISGVSELCVRPVLYSLSIASTSYS
jgi:hypothetical protein